MINKIDAGEILIRFSDYNAIGFEIFMRPQYVQRVVAQKYGTLKSQYLKKCVMN